jgi:chromosome partitioning protein
VIEPTTIRASRPQSPPSGQTITVDVSVDVTPVAAAQVAPIATVVAVSPVAITAKAGKPGKAAKPAKAKKSAKPAVKAKKPAKTVKAVDVRADSPITADPAVVSNDKSSKTGQPIVEQEPAPLPDQPTRLIALMNQKGGVGKTTSAVNIGAALAKLGKRVLMIDLDPQAHMSLHMGVDPDNIEYSVYDLLTDDDLPASEVAVEVSETISVIASEVNLAGVEAELAPKVITGQAQRMLKSKVQPLLEAQEAQGRKFDYVLIDCPPSLGLLTINALSLAQEVIVPMQAHFLALQGLSKLLETVQLIRGAFNPLLQVSGIVLCMHERQTILAKEVLADLEGFLEESAGQDVPWSDARVYQPPIRRNIKLAESPSFGSTIFDYAPDSNGAKDYLKLGHAVASQLAPKVDSATA